MTELDAVGGIPVVMKALLDAGLLHGEAMTVTGKVLADNLKEVRFPSGQDVVHPIDFPINPTGTLAILKGNLAPEGCVVKVAGVKKLFHHGPARKTPSRRSSGGGSKPATWS